MTTPTLVALVPCEDLLQSVTAADGRATLHRLVYDLYSARFPARIGALVAVLVFAGGSGEYQGALTLTAPNGDVVLESGFQFTARTFHVQAVNLTDAELPVAGTYALNVTLEGTPLTSAPLVVSALENAGVKGPSAE